MKERPILFNGEMKPELKPKHLGFGDFRGTLLVYGCLLLSWAAVLGVILMLLNM